MLSTPVGPARSGSSRSGKSTAGSSRPVVPAAVWVSQVRMCFFLYIHTSSNRLPHHDCQSIVCHLASRYCCHIMSSGSWFGSRWIELINNRSLFVSVTPVPATLSERRAVLNALQRHGPIEVFKKIPVG